MTVKRRTISLILRFVKHVIMGDNTNLYDLRELDKPEFEIPEIIGIRQ